MGGRVRFVRGESVVVVVVVVAMDDDVVGYWWGGREGKRRGWRDAFRADEVGA